jgi:hypothetical protein
MTEMACKDILKQLSDYIEGDIPPALMAELQAHIDTCSNCRIVLDTTRKTIKLYHHHAEDQQAPDSAVEHLYRTLNLDDFLPSKEVHG